MVDVNTIDIKISNMAKTNKNERQPLLETPNDSLDLSATDKRQNKSPLHDVFKETSIDINGSTTLQSKQASLDNNNYIPTENRNVEHPTSNFETMIHLLKGNIGTGVLAMPSAFRNSGLITGFFGTLLMGAICTHCMHMLLRSAHELCLRCKVPSLGFSDVVLLSFETGPTALRKLSSKAKFCIDLFLCLTQIGFCCVYFLFVAMNLQEVIAHYWINLSIHFYLILLLLPMILLNWLKTLKYLAPVSLLATLLMVSGLVITFWYILQNLPQSKHVNSFAGWSKLPLYFGTVIFAFEGIGIVLPLENNMRTPRDFGGWDGVLNTGMVIITCLYTAVGFFGYLKYGEAVKVGSITLNLPNQDMLAQSVRVMMALSIFLSYCLQFYVPMNIIWPLIKHRLPTEKSKNIGEYIARTILVFITFTLAALIPNLSAVISLVGAFSSSALALIFPPIIEILTFWPNKYGAHDWIFWKDIFLIIFGVIGFFFGTYVSILDILKIDNVI